MRYIQVEPQIMVLAPRTDLLRVLVLLCSGCSVFLRDDIQSCSKARKKEPLDIHFYMLNCRVRFSHVSQGFRHCAEVDSWGT